MPPDAPLHLTDGQTRDVVYIQILVGIFFARMEVDGHFVKDRALGCAVYESIGVLLCDTEVIVMEKFPRRSLLLNTWPVNDVAQMRLNGVAVFCVFEFDYCHGTAIPAEPSNPVITESAALAFRKHRCENIP
jgi:hypothetical protein